MKSHIRIVLAVLCLVFIASPATARTWTDSSGQYTVDADLVGFDGTTIVLKKENHELVAIQLSQLSKADQQHLVAPDVQDQLEEDASQFQVWTSRKGRKVEGRVVDYARREIVIQRRRGKIYVNDKLYDNLPEVYRYMIPEIVSHFEGVPVDGRTGLREWAVKQKAAARTFTCEGVLMEFKNGDLYGIPFFFISKDDLEVLKPGWEKWVASNAKPAEAVQADDQKEKERLAFLLEAQAQAYQQDRQARQQIQQWQSIQDWMDLWEVTMMPRAGGVIQQVVVPARDSRQARQAAQAKLPTHVPGATKKLQRRY